MRHCLCLALLAAAALLGSCSSKSNNPGQSGPSVMFWLDSGNLAIESFDSAHPPLGEPVTIDRIISGSNTQLGSSAAAAVLDPAGNRLFVANGTAILVFDNASAANGNQAPARVIQKSGGAFVDVVSLSLDASRDLLYVGDKNVGGAVPSLYVIGNASAANGPVTPASITDNSTSDRRFVFIAANDVLYAAGNCQIAVFDAASTLNGPKAPDRQLDGCAALDSDDHPLWFDAANDDLYVLNASNADPGVMIFNGASASGSAEPRREAAQRFPRHQPRSPLRGRDRIRVHPRRREHPERHAQPTHLPEPANRRPARPGHGCRRREYGSLSVPAARTPALSNYRYPQPLADTMFPSIAP